MMSPRIQVEVETLTATLARTERAALRLMSPDHLDWEVAFDVRTLVRGDDGVVREEERVVPVAYDLAGSHPVVPPMAVALQLDLFNPHIRDPRQKLPLPPVPVLCLGGFRVQQRLADWVVGTYYMLAYARIATQHGLNPDAVEYARRAQPGTFPIDKRPFFTPARPAAGAAA
jgi:hypothetical protein